jgi:hypothetical protein
VDAWSFAESTRCFSLFFFCNKRRIILDNSWVHQHVTTTLDYTNI